MDERKVIKICIIVFGVFFILALIESSIRGISNGISNLVDKREENKKQEEIYNSDESKTERQIEKFIQIIHEAIEDKDYEYVYNSIDEVYRDYKFSNDKNKMIAFIENELMSGESYQVLKIEKNAGLYQTLVRYNTKGIFMSKYYTVDVISENECKIMFDEILSIKRNEIARNTTNAKYLLKYIYESPGVKVFAIEILNKTQEKLDINFEEISAISSDGQVQQGLTTPKSLSLKASESILKEFVFSDKIGLNNLLEIKGTENGQAFTKQFVMKNGL